MSGDTFLELTNRVLNRLNEVVLNESNFNAIEVRGIHAAAKAAVQDAITEISLSEQAWPFNAYQHTQNLIKGVNEYVWPEGFRVADWSSFQLIKDDTLNTQSRYLKKINREQWYSVFRDQDVDSGNDGKGQPYFVFDTHGIGFGVTPKPDENYPITFRYYKNPDRLFMPDDQTLIPKDYSHVIILRALVDMYYFLDNTNRAAATENRYKEQLSIMRSILINKPKDMFDRRVPHAR